MSNALSTKSQQKLLFISDGQRVPTDAHGTGNIFQLQRIQDINTSATITREDVFQFGQQRRIGTIVLEPPSSEVSFSYLLNNGFNESKMGFSFSDDFTVPAASGLLDSTNDNPRYFAVASGHNLHILYVPNGNDAAIYNGSDTDYRVRSIGNAFLSELSIEAAVGSIPMANATYMGNNTITVQHRTGLVPSVNLDTSAAGTGSFTLPNPSTGDLTVIALRPGDIGLTFGNASLFTDIPDARKSIQSFSISIPFSRSNKDALGSDFGYGKDIDLPQVISINISATVRDIKEGNLLNELNNNPQHAFTIAYNDRQGNPIFAAKVVGAELQSETASQAINDDETADLTFTASVGAANDTTAGVFFSGAGV